MRINKKEFIIIAITIIMTLVIETLCKNVAVQMEYDKCTYGLREFGRVGDSCTIDKNDKVIAERGDRYGH